MEVILTQDVKGLGKKEDVVKVKDGFARNYLFPKKIAVEANKPNLKVIQQSKKSRDIFQESEKRKAIELADKLSGYSFNIRVDANQQDIIYGSVTGADIAAGLQEEGYKFKEEDILLEEPIKKLGVYEVLIRLYPEVETKIKIWVVRKSNED